MKLSMLLFSILLALPAFAKPNLLFVHGAHFTGKAWGDLPRSLGHSSLALTLPTQGSGLPAFWKGLTLKDYARHVCGIMKAETVLIGHSQGGAVINQALGLCPEKVRGLVYVAATIPFPGEKPFELFSAPDDVHYFQGVRANEQSGLFEIFNPGKFLEGFASDASAIQKRDVLALAHPEPIAPSNFPLEFDLRKLESLPKLVILTAGDFIVTPGTQKKYASRLKNALQVEVQAGHLPMVTKPKEVAAAIRRYLKASF